MRMCCIYVCLSIVYEHRMLRLDAQVLTHSVENQRIRLPQPLQSASTLSATHAHANPHYPARSRGNQLPGPG